MEQKNIITILVFCIASAAIITTIFGIFTNEGPGSYDYESIRGENVVIYGKGIYQHMSAEVVIQGIAQDYVTLFIGVPLLLLSLYLAVRGSLKGRILLAGTLGYFLVTYLFYLVMAMYNPLFLLYAFLMGASFFGLALMMLSFDIDKLRAAFTSKTPVKFAGGFLIFNAFSIAILWLSIVIPPLIDGSIYPVALEHYTTLIVQGFDLGLLLPLAVISGALLIKKNRYGYLLGPVYFIFLALLMTALVAKIVAMGMNGYNIIPVIFIIPTFNLFAIICSILLLKNLKTS
ncbi:MAG: hypothetical protein MUC80_00375 [Candidatus Thermoplasmatota archaeon]|nr:hypothetical protein [Candidatus Thermoplasmatota archaeon]